MQQAASLLFLLSLLVFATCSSSTDSHRAEPHQGSKLRRLFNDIDSNHDHALSAVEILKHAERVEGHRSGTDPNRLTDNIQRLVVTRLDQNANGAIEWKEFQQRFARLDSNPNAEGDKLTRDEILFENPQQIHLSLTDKTHTEMVVMWVTSESATGSVVQYGTSASLGLSTSGTSYSYDVGVLGWNGMIHKVFLTNLNPGTRYYYRVGDASLNVWSGIKSFKTETPGQTEVKIATFGDMGTVIPLGFEVTDQMIADDRKFHFDLITHLGDLAYAGVSASWEFEYFWDLWAEQVAPLADHIPYMTAVGNHEKYYNFTSFKARFEMPGEVSGGVGDFYHSWDYAGIHFVSMCTEDYVHTYKPGSRQYSWLEQDLASANANRAKTPWIFIMGHRPMYSSDLSTDSGPLQQYIEPLLKKYKVDLAMWGHMHCYERTYPVYNNVPTQTSGNVYVNPSATTHLTIGTSGAVINEKFQEPAPTWSAKRTGGGIVDGSYDSYGYGYLHIYNSTHLYFEFRRWVDDTVWDDLWIIKN